jgi:hypothetical protein
MICRGCGETFPGMAAYCLRCETKQLADAAVAAPTPAPARSMAPKSPELDFDALYRRSDGFQPRSRSRSTPQKGNPALFLGWFAALAIASAWLSQLQLPTPDIAMHAGYVVGGMFAALILAGIGRIFASGRFGKIYLVTWSLVVALNGVTAVLQASGIVPALDANALKAQQDAIRQLVATAQGTAAPAPSTSTPVAINRPFVEPEADALTDVINQVNAALGLYNQHIFELNSQQQALGLDQVLAPQNLVTRAGIQHGRTIVAAYGKILDDYQVTYDAYVEKVQQIFAAGPPASRARLLPAFQQHVAESRDAIATFVSVERQMSANVSAVLNIAQANLGVSQARGNVIYLPQHALLEYRQHIASLQALSYQEQAASERLQQMRRMAITQTVAIKTGG